MEIKLLDYCAKEYFVEIPDTTEYIYGEIISGDMILKEPKYFDTGLYTRTMNFYDGAFKIARKDFKKFNNITDSYQVFNIDENY